MSAASTSDARKRNAPVVDAVEIVARAVLSHLFVDRPRETCGCGWRNPIWAGRFDEWRGHMSTAIVAALRAEGLLT